MGDEVAEVGEIEGDGYELGELHNMVSNGNRDIINREIEMNVYLPSLWIQC